jgi:hypothetical protein
MLEFLRTALADEWLFLAQYSVSGNICSDETTIGSNDIRHGYLAEGKRTVLNNLHLSFTSDLFSIFLNLAMYSRTEL